MAHLEAAICDVWGVRMAGGAIVHTATGGGLEVIDPLNDSRTARTTLSIFDRAARMAKPLSRVLSITYGPALIFKGPILSVKTNFAEGIVEVYAHDPSIRLKHHYHYWGDYAVEVGFPIDGRGMQTLIESAMLPTADLESGIPPTGILWGNDTTTHQGARPPGGTGIYRTVKSGTNVWESMQNLSQVWDGPDFRLRPVDRDHVGVYPVAVHDSGYMVEIDTADRLGQDRHDTIIFEHGQTDTADNIIHEPDGDAVRNEFVMVYPGGQRNRGDDARKAVARSWPAIHDYGVMQGYESSGQAKDTQEVLKNKARAYVAAYARPLDYFTVAPRISYTNVPAYPFDFKVGDTIRARAQKGQRSVDLIGRVMQAKINSVDQSGNSRVELTCVPTLLEDVT